MVIEEVNYEGYGPGGVAILVECQTDNKNRTTAEVRHVFTKFNGNLGANGCVSYLFDRKGVIVLDAERMRPGDGHGCGHRGRGRGRGGRGRHHLRDHRHGGPARGEPALDARPVCR